MKKAYFTYILSNDAHTLYIGFTDDIARRVWEHKNRIRPEAFTARYTYDRLVYYEIFDSLEEAMAREKQLKGWLRKKKIALIESVNPRWHDLSSRFDDPFRLRRRPRKP